MQPVSGARLSPGRSDKEVTVFESGHLRYNDSVVADEVITVGELQNRIGTGRIHILDAREPEDFADGHIPGAVNLPPATAEHTMVPPSGEEVPHQLINAEQVVPFLRAAGVCSDLPVCVYDDGGTYVAARLWWILDFAGHQNVRLLDGGYYAWSTETGMISTTASAVHAGTFTLRAKREAIVDFSEVIAIMGDADSVLCNTLSSDAFHKGAIQGSINYPYTETFAHDNYPLLKSRHELAASLAERGITHRQRIICYCEDGYSAAQVYFAARYAGFPRVSLYDGSMTDWVARGGGLVPAE
jgi:thiosulfate/3-mercaptopyruvate sulfurtransferase